MKLNIFTRTDSKTTRKTLEIFRQEIEKERRSFWVGVIFVPLSTVFSIVLLPLVVSYIIQAIVTDAPVEHFMWLLGAMAVISVLGIVSNQIGFREMFNHEERIVTRLLDRAMKALLDHSQMFFSNQKVGSLANDVNTFSRSYLTFMDTMSMQFSGIAVSYIASLVVVAFIAPVLLIPLVLLTTFIVWHSMRSMVQRAPHRNKRKELQSQLIGQLADILGNQTLVRMFGKKRQELAAIHHERQKIVDVAYKEIDMIQANAKVRQTVLYIFQIVILGMIIWLYDNQAISVAAAVFTITYLVRVISTMFNITAIIRGVEQSFLDAAKITEMLELEPDVRDVRGAKALELRSGAIAFDSVDFSYSDASHETVFSNLTIDIPAGTRVGLVGKSGGGKTTFTSLLLRYHDIDAGVISIDGNDISKVRQDSLRNAISYVPQDPYLFHRSLRENIAYGSDAASDKDIKTAAEQAYAWEFIEKLPRGLDTIVGERGVKLSGGQRQRIAIARAILKNAPILVLDEATSALDSESEVYIQRALTELMRDRTSIVIAHRLSTIAKLDRIIVLDNGQIIEDGTHEELVKAGGVYSELWKHQSGGFIDE